MTSINEIMIIGADTPIDSELTTLSSVLCIGNGKDVGLKLIEKELQEIVFADNLRVDIHAHGNRDEEKQHNIFGIKTEDFLKRLNDILVQHSGEKELAIEYHLWSCFGGSGNKATSILGEGKTFITHTNSRYVSTLWLDSYSCEKSIKNYLENPEKDPYTRWVEEQKYAFQPSTFNFNLSNIDTIHLKSTCTLKLGILEDIVEKLKAINDLKAVFTDFIAANIREIESSEEFKKAKELEYFKNSFAINEEEAKNLAHGIVMYLNNEIENQNFDLFREYISVIHKNGVDIDSSVFGYTVLLDASYKNKPETVELFIKKYKADVNKADKNGITPLRIAAGERYEKVVETLLGNGADVNKADNCGVTPLWMAAREGYEEIVETLLENEADVNKADNYGVTPLWMAARKGHKEVVAKLIEHKANINKTDNYGVTPLCIAARKENVTVVITLLEHEVNADIRSIKYIKKANIDIDMPAKDGSTMLLRAIKNKQTDIVESLLKAGADPNKANSKDSTTPLKAAMSAKNKNIILLIAKHTSGRQDTTSTPAASTCSKSNSKIMGIS